MYVNLYVPLFVHIARCFSKKCQIVLESGLCICRQGTLHLPLYHTIANHWWSFCLPSKIYLSHKQGQKIFKNTQTKSYFANRFDRKIFSTAILCLPFDRYCQSCLKTPLTQKKSIENIKRNCPDCLTDNLSYIFKSCL